MTLLAVPVRAGNSNVSNRTRIILILDRVYTFSDKLQATRRLYKPWFFGISRGEDVGLSNGSTELTEVLLGVTRKEPEQVRESDTLSTQSPRDPKPYGILLIARRLFVGLSDHFI